MIVVSEESKNSSVEKSTEKAPSDARIAPGAPAAAPEEKKPLGKGQRIALIVVAIVAIVLIAVSAFFLFSPGEDKGGSSNLMQTTASSSSATSSSSAASSASSSASSSAKDEAADSAEGGSSESTQVVQSGTETVVTPGQGGSSSAPAPAPDRDVVTVSISVTSATVGNPVSAGPMEFTFERGATVLDALVATGLSVNATNSGFGAYVAAIGGLAEDPSKGAWGWKYSVNGVDPQMSAGLYKLEDGDVIAWRYVTDING